MNATLGRTEPRLWTPPLRELTPASSYGFAVIRFAERLGLPLDPWEQWAAIHLGELLPDGRPRFRQLLILVARQNGKTTLLVVLTLYWLFVDRVPLVLGTSTKLDYAAESWRLACRIVRRVARLRREVPPKGGIRKANGEQVLWRADAVERLIDDGSRYKIAASNSEGGRSLSIDRLIMDELRQQYTYEAWDASVPAASKVGAQVVGISNAGVARSVVLNNYRASALKFITTGEGDYRKGLLEWSAPEDASPDDLEALAQANPNLRWNATGHYRDADELLAEARDAMYVGGEKLVGFKTERMCITVTVLDPAVDMRQWDALAANGGCLDPGTLDDVRDRVAVVAELSEDGLHATLYAAALLPDGRTRVDPVDAWAGPDAADQLRAALPDHLERIQPRAFGWLPGGPAAAITADVKNLPAGITVETIKGETNAVCMGFAEQVIAGRIAQSADPLLDTQLAGTEKEYTAGGWRFMRRGAGHCDASYAAAGAVHLARTLPPPKRKSRIVLPTRTPE